MTDITTGKQAVLSLCDVTANMVRPWADAGYVCFCVDVQHPRGVTRRDDIYLVGADIRDWLPPREDYAAAFALTPCTNLSVSGARWFQEKGIAGLLEGLNLFRRGVEILEWTEALWMAENPVSTLSTYFRKPDYAFHPYEYAGYLSPAERHREAYTKKTCLWVGGGFRMPPARPVRPALKSYIHFMPLSSDRANRRSVTPRGFAEAVFRSNSAVRNSELSFAGAGCRKKGRWSWQLNHSCLLM